MCVPLFEAKSEGPEHDALVDDVFAACLAMLPAAPWLAGWEWEVVPVPDDDDWRSQTGGGIRIEMFSYSKRAVIKVSPAMTTVRSHPGDRLASVGHELAHLLFSDMATMVHNLSSNFGEFSAAITRARYEDMEETACWAIGRSLAQYAMMAGFRPQVLTVPTDWAPDEDDESTNAMVADMVDATVRSAVRNFFTAPVPTDMPDTLRFATHEADQVVNAAAAAALQGTPPAGASTHSAPGTLPGYNGIPSVMPTEGAEVVDKRTAPGT